MRYLGKIEDDKDLINVEYASAHYLQEVTAMPTASEELAGNVVQYLGATGGSYVNGHVYRCVESAVAGTYEWSEVSRITVSTSAPSGGEDGDIWLQVV